ncbi:hypothetical protein ACU4GA_31480 [Methylobacterium oryzae CBMB20]
MSQKLMAFDRIAAPLAEIKYSSGSMASSLATGMAAYSGTEWILGRLITSSLSRNREDRLLPRRGIDAGFLKLIDKAIFERLKRKSTARPPLLLVLASVISTVVIWGAIYLNAGHIIWFW